jgi:phage terminase large subunit
MSVPTLDFKLHDKQAIAFTSSATEILYGGAAGGGKSYLMRVSAIAWCLQIPGIQIYLFRRTFDELYKSHVQGPSGFIALLNPLVRSGHVKVLAEEIRFTNGSRIFLKGVALEEDVAKFLSNEFHVLMIDEASSFTESMYKQLRGRVRMTGLRIPEQYKGKFPRILISSNPGGIGHAWLKQMFVDGALPLQIRQMPPEEGSRKRQFIPALVEDNPTLMEEDPTYVDSLQGLGSPELVRAMRYGDWNILAGAFFSEFSTAKHVIEPFDIPKHWNRICAGDVGFAEPFAFLWLAVASEDYITSSGKFIPKDAIVCYREYYGCTYDKNGKLKFNEGQRLTPVEIALEIKKIELVNNDRADDRIIDPAARNHTVGPSWVEMASSVNVYFRKGDNTRIPGWLAVRQRLRGINDRPMLYIFNTCEHLIRTLPLQQHDTKKPEDMITRGVEDHLVDALRYGCMSRPWTSPTNAPKPKPVFRNPTMGELTNMVIVENSRRQRL